MNPYLKMFRPEGVTGANSKQGAACGPDPQQGRGVQVLQNKQQHLVAQLEEAHLVVGAHLASSSSGLRGSLLELSPAAGRADRFRHVCQLPAAAAAAHQLTPQSI